LQEFRITERRIRNRSIPQSVWKLNNGVSVGGQTIMGIPYLHRLRYGSGELLRNRIKIWPFETGWSIPETPSIVLTEIFPSLLPLQNYGVPRDLDQVLTCVNHAATLDVCGRLAGSFNFPIGLTTEELTQVETEEGWTLFS
jgi:hypothetical protein